MSVRLLGVFEHASGRLLVFSTLQNCLGLKSDSGFNADF